MSSNYGHSCSVSFGPELFKALLLYWRVWISISAVWMLAGDCGNYMLSLNRLVSNPQLSVAHEYPLKNFNSNELTLRWPMRFQNGFNIPWYALSTRMISRTLARLLNDLFSTKDQINLKLSLPNCCPFLRNKSTAKVNMLERLFIFLIYFIYLWQTIISWKSLNQSLLLVNTAANTFQS